MKYGVWVLYVGGAAAIALGSGWVGTAGHVAIWVTLAAHLAEFLVKRPLFERAGGSMGHHFVQTMIYGLFHWRPIEQQLDAASPSAARPDARS